MKGGKTLEDRCDFTTERLNVRSWRFQAENLKGNQILAEKIGAILSPAVTKSLPNGWQGISTITEALEWMEDRAAESSFFTVQLLPSKEIVGFVFLYEDESQAGLYDLRFGYLLAEAHWGKGLGTELVQGLVKWCEEAGDIHSLSGGVARDNMASIKVLERCGFTSLGEEAPSESVIFYARIFK